MQHLEGLGHQEGRTFLLEARWAEGDNSRFPALARELLDRRPAVIVAPCGPALRAIRELSRSVPVVAGCADPKNFLGEVASLSRPGGRTTGMTFLAPESAAKRLQLLKELLPRLSRVGILHHRHDDWGTYLQEMERAAPQLGLTFSKLPLDRADDLEGAFAAAVRQRAEALVVFPDAITVGARKQIATLAIKQLPTVFDTRIFVVDGGLFSNGPDWFDMEFAPRIIARYIDKILKGAAPGDLPVQEASRLQLVVNLRTARMLGLNVPTSFLSRADEVLK
jgi:putative ABC transport system substrate-binding protein